MKPNWLRLPLPGRPARRLPRDQQGQSLTEVAMVLPVMLLFLLGATNFGLALQAHMRLSQALQQATQLLIHHPESADNCSTADTSTYSSTLPYYPTSCYALSVASYLYGHGFSDIANATITVTSSTDAASTGSATSTVKVIKVSVDYPFPFVMPGGGALSMGPLQGGKLHLGATATTIAATVAPTIASVSGTGPTHSITVSAFTDQSGVTPIGYEIYWSYTDSGGHAVSGSDSPTCPPATNPYSNPTTCTDTSAPSSGYTNLQYQVTAIQANGLESPKSTAVAGS